MAGPMTPVLLWYMGAQGTSHLGVGHRPLVRCKGSCVRDSIHTAAALYLQSQCLNREELGFKNQSILSPKAILTQKLLIFIFSVLLSTSLLILKTGRNKDTCNIFWAA